MARRVVFDITDWKKEYGEGTAKLINLRHGESTPYEVEVQREDDKVYWVLDDIDTNISGLGKCELQYLVNDITVKSFIYDTIIHPTIGEVGAKPNSTGSWVKEVTDAANLIKNSLDDVDDAVERAEKAAERAEGALIKAPYIGDNNNWWVWDASLKQFVDSGIQAYIADAVRYNEEQALTETQKKIARDNIGAGTSNFSGSYNDLTDKPFENEFTLPQASTNVLGGIKADPVTDQDTQEVHIGEDGKLYTASTKALSHINPIPKNGKMTSPVGVSADGRLWSITGGSGGSDYVVDLEGVLVINSEPLSSADRIQEFDVSFYVRAEELIESVLNGFSVGIKYSDEKFPDKTIFTNFDEGIVNANGEFGDYISLYAAIPNPWNEYYSSLKLTVRLAKSEYIVTATYRASDTEITGTVLYNKDQVLTEEEKDRARRNIGATSAVNVTDNLYSILGEVASPVVCKLVSTRRVLKYLVGDMTTDAFIRIQNETLEYVTGTTDGTSSQAKTPDGKLCYWEQNISQATLAPDGLPYIDKTRVNITTVPSPWPVMVYNYTDEVQRGVHFEMVNELYTPIETFGAGDGKGNDMGYFMREPDAVKFIYRTPLDVDGNTKDIGIILGKNGYADIYGLRKTIEMDFSSWDNGVFYELIEGIESDIVYNIEFEQDPATGGKRPIKITQQANGEANLDTHEVRLIWG